jgi:hypothetical protein
MKKEIYLTGWFVLLVFVIAGLLIAGTVDAQSEPTIDQNPSWLRAQELKTKLDSHPQAMSRERKAQFDALFERIRREHDTYWSQAEILAEKNRGIIRDNEARNNEVSNFNTSCSSPTTQSQLQRCQQWSNQLNEWGNRINSSNALLEREAQAHNNKVNQWATEIENNFNKPLEQALAIKEQRWIFIGKGLQEKYHTANVLVQTNGSYVGEGWKTYVPGCQPEYYDLHIDGNFSTATTTVRIFLHGKGCGEQSEINGQGTGTANRPLPDATEILYGTIEGTIKDPLTPRGRPFNVEWTGKRQ